MANSSWFETTNLYIKYRIEVTINSQNLVDNLSNITIKVKKKSTIKVLLIHVSSS